MWRTQAIAHRLPEPERASEDSITALGPAVGLQLTVVFHTYLSMTLNSDPYCACSTAQNVICHTIMFVAWQRHLEQPWTILDFLPATQFKPICRKYGRSNCDITRSPLKGCCKACPLNQIGLLYSSHSQDTGSYSSPLYTTGSVWNDKSQVFVEKKLY